jgi:glycosyltransferase involved in cell wall biosynthesis
VYRSVAEQAKHLRSQGHDVDIVTRSDLAGPAWARFDPIVLPLRLLRRDLSSYDVIVFHSYLGWAFHLLRRWFDSRVVSITWFHGLEPLYHRAVAEECSRTTRSLSRRFRLLHHEILPRLMKRSCRGSDGVFCFNSIEADYLISQEWASPSRVHRVSNGVEADCFLPRIHWPVARRLLFVGQWLPGKGTRYLVDAFTSLAALNDFELTCVGTGASRESVLADFPAIVRPHVTVIPHADRAQLYDQLRHADLFLFPTLSEGFSCALLEAMAAQLPIVTTPVGAAADLLADGRNAVLVPCANASALAAAIVRLAAEIKTRAALGSSACQTAARFTTRASGREFTGRLLDVVNRRGGATTKSADVRPDAA